MNQEDIKLKITEFKKDLKAKEQHDILIKSAGQLPGGSTHPSSPLPTILQDAGCIE